MPVPLGTAKGIRDVCQRHRGKAGEGGVVINDMVTSDLLHRYQFVMQH